MKIAVVFIQKGEKYFLQLRDNNPAKGAAGLIGSFGGKIEPGETAIQAAQRELEEETGLKIRQSRLENLGAVTVTSDYQLRPVEVHITAFLLRLQSNETVVAREGAIEILSKAEAMAKSGELTPGTLACFKELIKE